MAPFGASRAGLMSVAEDDIPDSVDNQWPADEGSGDTLENDIGDVDIDLLDDGTGWSWDSNSKWDGDTAPESDGSNDTIFESQQDVKALNAESGGIVFWVEVTAHDSNAPLYSTDVASAGTPENGTTIRLDDSDIKLLQQDSGSGAREDIYDAQKIDERVLYAVGWDGNDVYIWGYDTSADASTAQFLNETEPDERGISDDETLSGFGRTDADRYITGGVEQIATFDETPTQNDVEQFWEVTK